MRPLPAELNILPEFKECKDVMLVRGPARTQQGRLGGKVVYHVHASIMVALAGLAVLTALAGLILLLRAIGSSEKQWPILGGTGFGLLGVGACSLMGVGATCVYSYRRIKAIDRNNQQTQLEENPRPAVALDLALMYS